MSIYPIHTHTCDGTAKWKVRNDSTLHSKSSHLNLDKAIFNVNPSNNENLLRPLCTKYQCKGQSPHHAQHIHHIPYGSHTHVVHASNVLYFSGEEEADQEEEEEEEKNPAEPLTKSDPLCMCVDIGLYSSQTHTYTRTHLI